MKATIDQINGAFEVSGLSRYMRLTRFDELVLDEGTDFVSRMSIRLHSDRRYFAKRRAFSRGGTTESAVCQLICWYRDFPRLPQYAWGYWTSEGVGVCKPEIIPYLEKEGYFDPVKVGCMFCGEPVKVGEGDWFSYKSKVGPGHDPRSGRKCFEKYLEKSRARKARREAVSRG